MSYIDASRLRPHGAGISTRRYVARRYRSLVHNNIVSLYKAPPKQLTTTEKEEANSAQAREAVRGEGRMLARFSV